MGRALRTKETLPDFREKCRVTRHSRVFRGLTGSQRTRKHHHLIILFFLIKVSVSTIVPLSIYFLHLRE